jgi:putative hydrolase of HD superfamily
MTEKVTEDIVKFISEAGSLKRTKRTGYAIHGSLKSDSVAEHSHRAMLIGYIIAKQEHADVDKVTKMLLFHDMHESRLGDLHKIAQRYLEKKDAEKQVMREQSMLLPEEMRKEFISLMNEFNTKQSLEARCANDADKLELAFQAKEFMDSGDKDLEDIVKRIGVVLKTKTAQSLYKTLLTSKEKWWDNLKKRVEDSY